MLIVFRFRYVIVFSKYTFKGWYLFIYFASTRKETMAEELKMEQSTDKKGVARGWGWD